MQEKNYSQQVSTRLMEETGIASIKDLVVFLDVNEGTFRSWLSRDSLDTRLIIAKCNDKDLNYILTGKREVNEGGNKGAKEGGNLDSDENLGFDMDSKCTNCQILIKKYYEAVDLLKAKNLSLEAKNEDISRLIRLNAHLQDEIEERKGSVLKNGTNN